MLKLRVFVFAVVCVAITAAMPDEMKELMDNLHKTCEGNVGVSEDLVSRAQKGDFADDENLKCYMRCLLDEIGLFDDGGALDLDGMIGMLPDDVRGQMGPVIKKCGATISGNQCEISFMLHKCIYNEAPSLYFLA